MKRLFGSWLFIVLMLALDIYVFQSLKIVTSTLSPKPRLLIHGIYWSFTIVAVLIFLLLPYFSLETLPKFVRTYLFAVVTGFFIAKLIAALFFLIDDLRRLFQWSGGKALSLVGNTATVQDMTITRSVFLSWLGIGVGGGLFGTLLYGFSNKYKYRVERIKLKFDNLPEAFKGIRVVHISDIHAGSLEDKEAVKRGIEILMKEKPDMVLFTGDLVNNKADEMDELKAVFKQVTAPMGVFSVLGNHDYGDYVQWTSKQEKEKNLNKLKSVHQEMGWNLLLNESRLIEREGQSIALIGIENWGAKGNFSKYGDLKKAYAGTENQPFKILMSHDPSHWDAEVCQHFKDIDITLSGHTHGMQFGVEIPGFRWSPVQYMYKQWAGVYKNGLQKLYVNRGFGFLGYPGRVGILPEITLIELT